MAEQSIGAGVSCIVMNEKDNVATLLRDAAEGEQVTYHLKDQHYGVTIKQEVRFGHKIAITPIYLSEHVIKYGESIGAATTAIAVGEHVHVHNMEGIRGRGDRKQEQGGKQK
jgi:altronate dehydratase small subunit